MKTIIFAFTLAGLTGPWVFADELPAQGNHPPVTVGPGPAIVQKSQVHGQVVDEAAQPVPGAVWKIAGTETLNDGQWTRVIRLGDPMDSFADAEGRFVVAYGEPIRYDLQFHKAGFTPAFLYEIAANSPHLKVTLKHGESIHGTVTRNVNGIKLPAAGETVELRLPSQDVWHQEQVTTDTNGTFEFRACAPPHEPPLPSGNTFGSGTNQDSPSERKWQVVCAGKVTPVEVRDGQAVEPVNFEIESSNNLEK
jgi:hypothetical protein